nr:MAG TPA: excisionase [Caudoviricetes sp.]
MQQRMNAKEYAKARGLPVETIRRLCRTNVLRYVQRGKVYLVNIACADAYFEAEEMRRQEKLQRRTVVKPVNMRQVNFKAQLADLRAEIL